MSLINTGQIIPLLRPGLNAVVSSLPQYPEQWTEIFKTYPSELFNEIDVEVKLLGAAGIKAQGQAMGSDTMGTRIITNYIHKVIAQSFSITEEAIDDNLYKSQFPKQAVALRDSLRVTKNILGANILNQAFNTANPIGDGQPLCSLNHPVDGGVYANTFAVPTDLTIDSLEESIIGIQKFPMQSGILSQTMVQKILVARENQFNITAILDSKYRVGTANNDINAIYHNSMIPKGWTLNQFLTSPQSWFNLTDATDGFKHFQRKKITTDIYMDFPTKNLLASATERYSFGVTNPRAVFGAQGTL